MIDAAVRADHRPLPTSWRALYLKVRSPIKTFYDRWMFVFGLHVLLAILLEVFTQGADREDRAVLWPLVNLGFSLLFFVLQWHMVRSGISEAYYKGPKRHARVYGVAALLFSYAVMWTLLKLFDWWTGSSGNVDEFMWKSMSYSVGLAFPVVTTSCFVVRVLMSRTRISVGLADTPLINLLPFFFVYAYVVPSLAAAYLAYYNEGFYGNAAPACFGGITVVAHRALRVAVYWRDLMMICTVLTVGGFYAVYAFARPYPRTAQVQLAAIAIPMVTLAWVSYRVSVLLTAGQCEMMSGYIDKVILVELVSPSWNLDALLIGWVAVVPLILAGIPFLMVTLHDPLKPHPEPRLASAIGARMVDDDDTLGLPVNLWQRARTAMIAFAKTGWISFNRVAAQLWLRITRAQSMGWAIWRNNLGKLVFALPISLIASVRPIVTNSSGSEFDVVYLGVVGSSLVWVSVLFDGLYYFQTTAQLAYEAALTGVIRRLNEHVIIIGYDDLGRRLAAMWSRRGLLGYETQHDHVLRGPNIILPDSRPARIITNLLVIDEPIQSGVGLVNVGPGVRGSLVSLTDFVRPLQEKYYDGSRTDPVLVRESDGLPAGPLSRLLVRVTKEFDRIVSELVDYSVPLIAGDVSASIVRDAARVSRARFIVSAELTKSKTSDSGFVNVEAIDRLQEVRGSLPMVAQVSSSALVSHLAARTIVDDVPIHVVPVDRLEASEAATRLTAAIQKLLRGGQDVRALLMMRGKKLFHTMDGMLSLIEPKERQAFASLAARDSKNLLVLVSQDKVVSDLPAIELKEPKDPNERFEYSGIDLRKLTNETGLKCRVVEYVPYVSRTEPQGTNNIFRFTSQVKQGITVLHIKADPRDYTMMVQLVGAVDPNIVFVSDAEMVGGLRALNTVRVALTRRAKDRPATQLLIAADRTRRFQERYYKNALWYSVGFFKRPEGGRRLYPGRKDGYVDPLRDAVERITGIWSAYFKIRGRTASNVVELHACSINRPGSIADTLVRLCGGDARSVGISGSDGAQLGVALLDTRLETGKDNSFTVRVLCDLVRRAPIDGQAQPIAYPSRDTTWAGCRLAIHTANRHQRSNVANHVLGILGEAPINGADLLEETAAARQSCCGMLSCPIEAAHKVVGAARLANEDDPLKAAKVESRLADRYWAAHTLDKNHKTSHPVWTTLDTSHTGEPFKDEQGAPIPTPRAFITLECKGSAARGTFAVALGTLLGWEITNTTHTSAAGRGNHVVHLTYLSGSECHDGRFGLFTLYGLTETSETRPIGTIQDVVQTVDIRPVNGDVHWKDYAVGLRIFLNQHRNNQQELREPYLEVPSEEEWIVVSQDQDIIRGKRKI